MIEKVGTRVIRSLTLKGGQLKAEPGIRTYRQGFGSVIDLSPQRVTVATLARGEPTRIAFARVGAALKGSFLKARE